MAFTTKFLWISPSESVKRFPWLFDCLISLSFPVVKYVMIRSAPEKLFICHLCGKSYVWKVSLTRHIRMECGKPPQFRCQYCEKLFTQRSSCQRHFKKQHIINSKIKHLCKNHKWYVTNSRKNIFLKIISPEEDRERQWRKSIRRWGRKVYIKSLLNITHILVRFRQRKLKNKKNFFRCIYQDKLSIIFEINDLTTSLI